MVISQLLLNVATSHLVGRNSKCYFIIKFIIYLLFSMRLCWREIRSDAGKTTDKMSLLQVFSEMTTQRSRFRQNSCTAAEQAYVLGSSESNKHSVLKMA